MEELPVELEFVGRRQAKKEKLLMQAELRLKMTEESRQRPSALELVEKEAP